jgi:signal transduction histidine kinase
MALARSFRGWPIAAYLVALMALALAAAFVAVAAIVIWLPPRPPDVMRADVVASHFQAGYDHMLAAGETMPGHMARWRAQDRPPRTVEIPAMRSTRALLADRLALDADQVRIAAATIVRSDVFVFRVRDGDEVIDPRSGEIITERRESITIHPQRQIELRVAMPPSVASDDDAPPAPEAPPPEAPPHVMWRGESVAPVAPVAPTPPVPPAPTFAPAPPGVVLISGFEIGAQLPDGRWLVMEQGRNWAELGWIGSAMLIVGGALTVLMLLAALFARRLTRPIRNFSDAVQAVGVDPGSEPVREEGPSELRGAARAVNSMQARLRALIADRTKTLAAVAHDMRTPLMRLRLVAENAEPTQRDRMAKEIEEVEALVASFIALARDDPAEEARVRLDLSALLQSIADDNAEAGRDVRFEAGERVVITGQSLGLKRLFNNLVENALKFGATARIALQREGGVIVVEVGDDGPGIPTDRRESVFEPFVRLNEEGARGAGLGLAAARSIARAHGGDVVIADAEDGALLRVMLPG